MASRGAENPDVQKRAFLFALRVLQVARALGRDVSAQVVARQIARSGTSVGANIEEAQAAHSRADFARRMNIARAEAIETHYWLRLIAESGMVSTKRLIPLIEECGQIGKILSTIVRKVRIPSNGRHAELTTNN